MENVSEAGIILHPKHPDYCNECIFHGRFDNCENEDYIRNMYKVNCVWHYCPYKCRKGNINECEDRTKKNN